MTGQPYKHTDENGYSLTVEPAPVQAATAVVKAPGPGAAVEALEIPAVTVAMYRACGVEPPVMLGRPDLEAMRGDSGIIRLGNLSLARLPDGKVLFAVGSRMAELPAAQARQAAAVAVALADEDPDEEAMFELAAVMAAHPEATFPELARAVLAAYRVEKREAGQ